MAKHFIPEPAGTDPYNNAALDGIKYADLRWPEVPDAATILVAAEAEYETRLRVTRAAYEADMARSDDDEDHGDAFEIMSLIQRNTGYVYDYDNLDEFHAWYLAEFTRGCQVRLRKLATRREDLTWRYQTLSEQLGRAVELVTDEREPVAVGTIQNLSDAENGTWLLECVRCTGPGYASDDETGEITSGPYWRTIWCAPVSTAAATEAHA